MADDEQLQRNKDFVRAHFEEFVNRKNSAVFLQNSTADFYDHDLYDPGGPQGRPTDADGDVAMMEGLYRRYPDVHVTIEDMVAEGDKVVCRNTWRGTDSQTGRRMEFHGIVLWRLEGGKLAERWAPVTSPAEVDPSTP